MRKIELEELKKIELDILKDVAKFCDENNIRYYLAYGTLIGAIRHKGFIPWDDDIDIVMPRPDYERFESIYPLRKDSSYSLVSLNINKNYIYPFAKIYDNRTVLVEKEVIPNASIGVYIDVFPMDGLPSDISTSIKHFENQRRLAHIVIRSVIKVFRKRKNVFRTIVVPFILLMYKVFISPTKRHKILQTINQNAKQYNFDTSEYIGVSAAGYGSKERIAKKSYIDQIEVEFEGKIFKAPKGYHEYLTNLYGDYMTPPPPEKQKTHHNFEAYWKDK